eukprot:2516188-Rhodomonas_salina.1
MWFLRFDFGVCRTTHSSTCYRKWITWPMWGESSPSVSVRHTTCRYRNIIRCNGRRTLSNRSQSSCTSARNSDTGPQTLDPQPSTLDSRPCTLDPRP